MEENIWDNINNNGDHLDEGCYLSPQKHKQVLKWLKHLGEDGPIRHGSDKLFVQWSDSCGKFPPVHHMSDLPWSLPLRNFFYSEELKQTSTCQSVMFKAALKLSSVVCVAGSAQGKSLGKAPFKFCNLDYLINYICQDGYCPYSLT